MCAGDLHDVSTVFGERAGTSRSSEDAGKVEDADAREWPITGWQRLGGAVADAHDLHQRQRCDRSACGCLAHSACVRAMPPAPFAAMIASSRSAAFQVATARATASRSSVTPSTPSAAAR